MRAEETYNTGDCWAVIDNEIVFFRGGIPAKVMPLVDHTLDGRPKTCADYEAEAAYEKWEADCRQYEEYVTTELMYEAYLKEQEATAHGTEGGVDHA